MKEIAMKKNRRDFPKITSITEIGLAGGSIMKSYASELNHDDSYLLQDFKRNTDSISTCLLC